MSAAPTPSAPASASKLRWLASALAADKVALLAVAFLLVAVAIAILGPLIVGDAATKVTFSQRNQAPFALEGGWLYVLGADQLGRPILARLIIGARNTFAIASSAVVLSMLIGAILGLIAGYYRRWFSTLIMRAIDVLMSFPSLLLALVVLYTLGPSIPNLILVLAITRIPVYLRTARAEVLEIRQRVFVSAARAMGAGDGRILFRHIAPLIVPTIITIGAIDFATVILAESALSFLGLGIQPPDFTWGAMVAAGRGYLGTAWWISFWPGLAIMLTTLSLNLVANWARVASDPAQRWKLQGLKDDADG